MAKIAIQKNLLAQTEQIETAEQLEEVFNNPETYRKVCQIREARKKGDLKKANSIKNSLEGLIFVADDFAECEKPVNIVVNGKKQEVMETFFVNSLWKDHKVNQGNKESYYIVDDEKRFRICDADAKSKIRLNADTIYARYNSEIGKDNQIPLWLLGFLY